MKFLTSVTLSRWQSWSAGYCGNIALRSCARLSYCLGFWERFWMTSSDGGGQVSSIKQHKVDIKSMCVYSFVLIGKIHVKHFYHHNMHKLHVRHEKWEINTINQIKCHISRDGFSNQCERRAGEVGSFPCGDTPADCLTLLRSVHLFVALKWHMAIGGGCENGLTAQ